MRTVFCSASIGGGCAVDAPGAESERECRERGQAAASQRVEPRRRWTGTIEESFCVVVLHERVRSCPIHEKLGNIRTYEIAVRRRVTRKRQSQEKLRPRQWLRWR